MARLIRGFGASAVTPRAVLDADHRAAAILAEAEANARARADAAEREAREQRAAAEAEARSDAAAEAAAMLAAARAARDRALAEAHREIVALSVAVARRIVGEAVDRDPALVEGFVAEALERARGASRLRVLVAPDDVPALVALAASSDVPLEVEADRSLSRGDCVVQGDVGAVDARLETKLATFHDALLLALGRESP